MSAPRGQWSSRIGFILAASGSAIGLGNIWRFPYITGQNGGAAFVLIYLIFVFLIGLPYMLGELAIGRYAQLNPVGAIRKIKGNSPWLALGYLGVLTGFGILSYYMVIAGWTFGYIFKMLFHSHIPFKEYIAYPGLNIGLTALFMLFTIAVVIGGVKNGIEKWSKILMPILFGLMLLVILRSVTLDGAMEGLVFYLKPDFSKITFKIILEALGQAFFSLSLGMGLMITYGSYLDKKENLAVAGSYVAIFDTLIAVMAGFMIFPAISAFGANYAEGPGLVFVTLPKIFSQMPQGTLIGAVFFMLLSIAALTSTISLLEVCVAYFVDEKKLARKIAVWLVGALTFLLAIPSALSAGGSDFFTTLKFFHKQSFLDIMDFIFGNLSLTIGALTLSIFIGYFWKADHVLNELRNGFPAIDKPLLGNMTLGHIWKFLMMFIIPILIFVVLINGLT